ncbi:hypothetical protein POM88_029101 [Heracleum sosnowskyi]|uniref:RNase H type-1 domain-containing protein n=1 Tax=Heracleum sosnowskyi TaxID=360622 RepID=A0AAD8HU30_9APIA|nr:hypothetical protein POM88_029101 [Heracleum sosnowskyi]
MQNSVWRNIKFVKSPLLRKAWEIALCSTLWSLWLVGNELVFSSKEHSTMELLRLIQKRAFEWSMEEELVRKEVENFWVINPEGGILLSNKFKRREIFYSWQASLVGIVDGSFKLQEDGARASGMGGILLNKKDEVIFMFSGKCNALSPMDAEIEAISFMVSKTFSNFQGLESLVICTDSALDIQRLIQIIAGKTDTLDYKEEWVKVAKNKAVHLYYMTRENLGVVDDLAKKGRELENISRTWT